MWQRQPTAKLVGGWLERALELHGGGLFDPGEGACSRRRSEDDDEAAAADALQLAKRLGDVALRSYALAGLADAR